MSMSLGKIVLFGSGEISNRAQPIYDEIMQGIEPPKRVAVLETPAGFQLNSADVAGAVADYIRDHLQNHKPEVTVVPARKRDTPFSPDDPEIVAPLLTSQMVFLGAGSPTYAVRQLVDSLAWRIILARHRLGHPIVLASAATIAVSAWSVPVYEIYKVGEDAHWKAGLDLWGSFGLSLVFVPHWNNNEGGEKHDTSRCFMGRPRFREMLRLLPRGVPIIGIDEYSALVMDPEQEICQVRGSGGVTLLRDGEEKRYEQGMTFPFSELGTLDRSDPHAGVPEAVWEMIADAEEEARASDEPGPDLLALVEERKQARADRDWSLSDRLRDRIQALGWQIRDTPEGSDLVRGG